MNLNINSTSSLNIHLNPIPGLWVITLLVPFLGSWPNNLLRKFKKQFHGLLSGRFGRLSSFEGLFVEPTIGIAKEQHLERSRERFYWRLVPVIMVKYGGFILSLPYWHLLSGLDCQGKGRLWINKLMSDYNLNQSNWFCALINQWKQSSTEKSTVTKSF